MIPIPIGDENPTSRRPVVNLSLIAANGLVFLWFNMVRGVGFFEMNPGDVQAWGLLPGEPTPVRFLSAMFLHANPFHLLGNMWFLHIFGDNVEDKVGRGKYLALYLLWGVLASLAFLKFGRPLGEIAGVPREAVERAWNSMPLVGASGAIAGVMGAYLVLFPRARIRMILWILWIIPFSLPALVVIGLYFLQDLFLGVVHSRSMGGVAYAAHTGGMLAGILAALVLKPFLRRGARATAWDLDTGFARAEGGAGPRVRPGYEPPRTFPLLDLRDQIAGAVLDGRMDLALELHREWIAAPRPEPLPPAVEMEIAHEILRRGRVEEAEAAYRSYLESHPRGGDAAEAKFRLGLIHARVLGDRAGAREWLRMAVAEHPDPETAGFARRELDRLDRDA